MTLHAINQAALVKSTDNSDNSCNMRAGFAQKHGTIKQPDMRLSRSPGQAVIPASIQKNRMTCFFSCFSI